MYSTIAARACARVAKSAPWTSSFFKEAKKLSIGALSQQSARRALLRRGAPGAGGGGGMGALGVRAPRGGWARRPSPGGPPLARQFQGIAHQPALQVVGHRPPDPPPRVQVLDGGQVQPAF